MAPDPTYTAIVAIDFGTSRTGYAFAFTADPKTVYINKTWPRGPHEGKTLTQVLLKREDHSLVAFGYEARDMYTGLADEEQEKYLFFSNFKMTLHNTEGASRQKVKASNCDDEIPVIRLIAACLKATKNKAMDELSASTSVPLKCDMIKWIITVPAIWDIAARHVMKEAGILAGIPEYNADIALEPEAGSISCLKNQLHIPSLHDNPFMVVDAGGGTVDITIHKMKTDGTLVEIHRPSGGHWGATTVNAEFAKMITMLSGGKIDEVRNTAFWDEVMDSFEGVKLRFEGGPSEPPLKNINIASLGIDADISRIESYNTSGTAIQLNRGILRIPTPTFRKFYQPSIESITAHIKQLLDNEACKSVKHIFLIGGYAESPVLVNSIKESVGDRACVICPPRPGTAVVNGAVHFGLNPHSISSRIAVRTIAVSMVYPWNQSRHHGRTSFIDDEGQKLCRDTVCTFITAGTQIDTNSKVTESFFPCLERQDLISFRVYATTKHEMEFSNDPGVVKIGELIFELPPTTLRLPRHLREVTVTMKFGGTVFSVSATCVNTGKSISSKFVFPLDV